MLSEPERPGILALYRFLNEVDPTQAKLGLHRVATYTGDFRWLCKHHYDAWQPNIPDVMGPPRGPRGARRGGGGGASQEQL
ncbi:MAG: hypothetical protein IPO36_07880 [Anaerolineales bacterium]|nr:hypothetical protein [Anaerolineales bacterium]